MPTFSLKTEIFYKWSGRESNTRPRHCEAYPNMIHTLIIR